ncbi:MAG: cob(I)yrinic acid a,c-diamide adenosyltransferase [Deltaproteobacteria bacterium]|nr:cob(I)yrinic acid a,c-diamide adenosyltransferase [Deltaproteobacteria bacterium]MBW2223400.1 cob(I)yrinic acid a,c-diamide adenosyltransferase [Deltaproteobacteria bacterium]MBW2403408.1 cob(I)yrinic acid a,c-diamide adenosyltransferase [Deltaproteobacteria bacterium]MBW2546169.1 cob(I)yrinic acid a,c-diamide adenosyltransferase [Deltaproteobacteria bacterium]MBW2717918.1 cob(I)yrinic acid a,c-diamide adenosyltransferase [Deltaproteobacteria bacterium]
MKIYTKTGDTGDTGLFGGARVSKASPRVEAYGEVDELNSAVGWARVAVSNADLDELLNQIQNDLFEVGAELGSTEDRKKKSAMPLIAEPQVEALERAIDKYEEGPPALTSFVLPGGSEGAARFHVARCVCRRAERSLVALGTQENLRGELFRYVNRLSDLLFVLARYANHVAGVQDIPWKGQGG